MTTDTTEYELPAIATSAYTSRAMNLAQLVGTPRRFAPEIAMDLATQLAKPPQPKPEVKPKEQVQMADDTRRLVQVYIADPSQHIPLDKSLLYRGEQILTDLSDQELFFEIPIAELLKKHNEFRVTQVDKSVKDKTVHLEPARIRDLRMVVVTIASF